MPCQCHFPMSTKPLSVILLYVRYLSHTYCFVFNCGDFIPKLLFASCKGVKISYLMHLGGISKNSIQQKLMIDFVACRSARNSSSQHVSVYNNIAHISSSSSLRCEKLRHTGFHILTTA